MAIRVIERPKQAGTVQFRGPTATREYVATGSFSKFAIQIAILGAAPGMETGVDPSNGDPLPLFLNKVSVKEVGGGTWEATCDYADTPNQWDLKFNVGTQTTKMQQCLEHMRTYDCILGGSKDGPGTFTSGIPDFFGAINQNGTGEVAGVDVEIAKIEFTITLKMSFASLESDYFWTIANMTPSVNGGEFTIAFKGQLFIFPKGSVLFRGGPMTVDSDGQVTFTFMFAYSRNLTLSAPDWNAETTYAGGDQVAFGGHLWTSVAGGNLDNQPVLNDWESDAIYQIGDEVYYNGTPATWSNAITYTIGSLVIYAGHSWRSWINANLNFEPDLNPTEWQDEGPPAGGHIYTSLIANNEGFAPSINPAEWTDNGAPLWTDDGFAMEGESVGNSGPLVAEGWWYKWPWYGTTVTNGTAVMRPKAIVLDRVYKYSDFNDLKIPSSTS